jgi:hypothetical protein
MIWAVGLGLLFFVLSIRELFVNDRTHGFLDFLGSSIATCLITAVGMFVGLVIAFIIGTQVEKQETSITLDLVSLRNSQGISGSFFLGTGSIGSSDYYFYNTGSEDAFRPGKVETNGNITVFQENRSDGKLIVFTSSFKEEWRYWYATHFWSGRYEFHIPKGSLKSGFVLN